MRTARPGASSVAHAPPRAASHARSCAAVVTSAGSTTRSVASAERIAQPCEIDERQGVGTGASRIGAPSRRRHGRPWPKRRGELAGSEPELNAQRDLIGLGQAGAEFAGEAAEAAVLEAQAERGIHVVTHADAVVHAVAHATRS